MDIFTTETSTLYIIEGKKGYENTSNNTLKYVPEIYMPTDKIHNNLITKEIQQQPIQDGPSNKYNICTLDTYNIRHEKQIPVDYEKYLQEYNSLYNYNENGKYKQTTNFDKMNIGVYEPIHNKTTCHVNEQVSKYKYLYPSNYRDFPDYNYEQIKKKNELINEEIIEVAFHPNNMDKWKNWKI
jgi:hypothetical protein